MEKKLLDAARKLARDLNVSLDGVYIAVATADGKTYSAKAQKSPSGGASVMKTAAEDGAEFARLAGVAGSAKTDPAPKAEGV